MSELFQHAEEHSRTARVLGWEAVDRLKSTHVAVFGIGGVGGHLTEALARAGVGKLSLFDRDTVSLSNINRQAVALHSTVGQSKVAVMADRIRDINPACIVRTHACFYLPEEADRFDFSCYDYVADAIDTVRAKIDLVQRAKAAGVPIICAMGAGNKLDPSAFRVSDISKTTVCPLARVMRRELRKRGIDHVKVVYSQEEALTPAGDKRTPGSVSFVPGAAGLVMAGAILRDLWNV